MANLRANNLTGTGGRNAIDGSVAFTSSTGYLSTTLDTIGTSDFTIEWWFKASDMSEPGTANRRMFRLGANNATGSISINYDAVNNDIQWNYNATNLFAASTIKVYDNSWYHVAAVREGTGSNETKLYINGVLSDTGTLSQDLTQTACEIGWDSGLSADFGFYGNISNLRVTKRALYTAAFTPPTEKVAGVLDTILLCCQSSSDVTEEAAGKTITSGGTPGPKATKITPSVGIDEGVTFSGDIKFNTQGAMYFPTGDTSQRGRGRGLFMGGYAPSQYRTEIDYIQIQSQGNAIDFGVLSGTGPGEGADCASSTRAIQGGGSLVNTMEYVTIATTSNTTDFGDLTVARRSLQSLSNETRGTWAGGTTNPAMSDVIDYVTIASAGNAADFGNLTVGRRNLAQAASPTRGVWAGGNPGSGPLIDDTIDYITIASAGNATDFGNLSAAYREMSGCSNGIRGVFGGGSPGPSQINTIEYITIATVGNVTDFGDLMYAHANGGGTSNGTRGIFGGGAGAAYTNTIQYITISTTGNAEDFGDLTVARILYSATSDSHGGLS